MEFYNPSEKIKLMRKKFRANQADLEGVNMTRAFISMMESGKRTVSKASSKALAEKFNNIAKRISVNLNLDDEYFSRTPKEDARTYCENEIRNNSSLKHKRLEELIEIEKKFNFDDLLAKTYKIDADIYISENEYGKAFICLNNSLGKYKEIRKVESQFDVYMQLGLCKVRTNQYDDAIFFYKQSLSCAEATENEIDCIKANHALATIYGQIQQYDKCLEILDNILNSKIELDKQFIVNAKLMKANVLYFTEKLDEAAKEYFQLVEEIRYTNKPILGMIYNNIAEYYYRIEDYHKGLHYVTEAQRIKTATNKEFLSSTLCLKGKILFALGLYEESIMLFELAIDMAEQYNRYDMLVDGYKELVKVLELKMDSNKVKEKMNMMTSTLERNNVEEGIQYAIHKLLEIATIEGNKNEAMRLLHQIEKFLYKDKLYRIK